MCFPIILKFLLLPETHNPLQLPVLLFPPSFCIFVKRKTLYNCLFLLLLVSANLLQNIGELEAKIYFTDHRTANTIHLFVPVKSALFKSILYQLAVKGNSPETT